jgi:SAM-dependent methyltransferase
MDSMREVDRPTIKFERGPGADVFEAEARFWDQQERFASEKSSRPYDWAFDLQVGNAIQAPTYAFMKRVLTKLRPRSVLDLGCGSGVYSRYMARYGGMRVVGVDLSPAKVARATELAREAGVSHLVDYRVGNALTFAAEEPVDAICAFGALHHLPDIEHHLPVIVRNNLRPDGFILAAEPFYEGYHPAILRLMAWIARSRFRRYFDVDRYEEIAGAAERGETIMGESPAGLVYHHASRSLDAYLRSAFDPILIRYSQFLTPFFANAFVIYQRSQRVASLARRLVPMVVRLDSFLCRFRHYSRWAALGLYAVRPPTRTAG